MKNIVKIIAYLILIIMIAVLVSGCESKDLVATKINEDNNVGKYEENIEIKFKDKKAEEVKIVFKLETEESAYNLYNLYKLFVKDEININNEEKSVTVKMNAETYFKKEKKDIDLSRKEIKKYLIEQGYKVK